MSGIYAMRACECACACACAWTMRAARTARAAHTTCNHLMLYCVWGIYIFVFYKGDENRGYYENIKGKDTSIILKIYYKLGLIMLALIITYLKGGIRLVLFSWISRFIWDVCVCLCWIHSHKLREACNIRHVHRYLTL